MKTTAREAREGRREAEQCTCVHVGLHMLLCSRHFYGRVLGCYCVQAAM